MRVHEKPRDPRVKKINKRKEWLTAFGCVLLKLTKTLVEVKALENSCYGDQHFLSTTRGGDVEGPCAAL